MAYVQWIKSYFMQETMNKILESVNVLKRAVCTVALPWIKTEAPSTVTNAADIFCNTNSTLFEVSLQTVNTVRLSLPLYSLWVYFSHLLLFFLLLDKLGLLPVVVFSICFPWFSDTDGAVGAKSRRDDDVGWDVGVGVWSVAEWYFTVGEPSSASWDCLFFFCWSNSEQHWSITLKFAEVT